MATFGMFSLWVALFSSLKPLDVHRGVAAADNVGPLAAASPCEGGIEHVDPGHHPQCALGVFRVLIRLIRRDPRRVQG